MLKFYFKSTTRERSSDANLNFAQQCMNSQMVQVVTDLPTLVINFGPINDVIKLLL